MAKRGLVKRKGIYAGEEGALEVRRDDF